MKKYENYYEEDSAGSDTSRDDLIKQPRPRKRLKCNSFGNSQELNDVFPTKPNDGLNKEDELSLSNTESFDESSQLSIEDISDELVTSLEVTFKNNPEDYESIVKLIEVYKFQKKSKEVNDMRQHMHRLYPLPQVMWIDWIKDEYENLNLTNNESKLDFLKFIHSSFNDFYCYDFI